jgi:mannose-6-phosphate isomerase-like protein (cupin superfamily)
MNVVNIDEKLAQIAEPWQPHVVGQVNDSLVKLVKFKGEFVWHHHGAEDEMFLVVRGTLRILVNDWGHLRELVVKPGEFVIIPRTMDHMPIADDEVHVMLFEPQTTLNTGNAGGERTISNLPRL